jgi:hypothetical protein
MQRINSVKAGLLLTIILPAFATPVLAQDAPVSMQEMWEAIQKQQGEIDLLKQENAQLKKRLTPEEPIAELTLGSVEQEEQMVPQSEKEFTDTASQEEEGARFEVFGFIQTDAIYDFDRVDPDWNDGSRPSKIPVADKREFGADGESIISIRQSRLGFRSTTPTSMGPINAWMEWDLYGTGNDAGETELNLRHFWAELGSFGAGQTWSNWMDIDIFPNTIDYWGPPGMIFIRKPQIRYTHALDDDGTLWSVALEDPSSDVDPGELRDLSPGLAANGQAKDSLFDVTSRFRSENDWGHWQAAGIMRRLEYETKSDGTPATANNNPSGNDWGWGINLTTAANAVGRDDLKLGLVYGEGIASYFNDGGSSLAPDSGEAKAIQSLGISAFYDHYWNENWSSAFGWSMHEQDNTNQQQGDAFKRGQLAQANLLWSQEEFLTGFEAIWSERENNDGKSNTDFRVQYTFKFNFAHTLLD